MNVMGREGNNSLPAKTKKHFVGQNTDFFPVPREDNKLPRRYCETSLVLMLRDPSWIYCYWDIENRILTELGNERNFSGLVLRVTELDGTNWAQESRLDWFDIPIQFEDLHRYINLPVEGAFFGAEIYAQIGSRDSVIVRSNIVESSRGCISPFPHTPDSNRDQLIELSEFFTDTDSFSGNTSFDNSGGELSEIQVKLRYHR